ncbi:MAG TPA: NAD(P)-binding protein [Myxococcaceae bacterium]|nr:NAD(P)-binding protein [Myxococcaceae bacterium]
MARQLSVLVVGAGVGGLAAAARLAHAGLGLQVLEQTDTRDLGRPMDACLWLHCHVLVPVRHVTAERVLTPDDRAGRFSPPSTGAPSGSATTSSRSAPSVPRTWTAPSGTSSSSALPPTRAPGFRR